MNATITFPQNDSAADFFGFDLDPMGDAWKRCVAFALVALRRVAITIEASRSRAKQRAADRETIAAAANAAIGGRALAARYR